MMAKEFVSSPSDANILARTIGHKALLDVVWNFDPAKDGDLCDFAQYRVRDRLANYVETEAPELMEAHHQPFATVTLGAWAYNRVAGSRIHPKDDDEPQRAARFIAWAKVAGLPGETRDELLMSATIRFTPWVQALAGSHEYPSPEMPGRRAQLVQAGAVRLSDLLRRFDPEQHGENFEAFASAEIADTLATKYQFIQGEIAWRVRTHSERYSSQSSDWQETSLAAQCDAAPAAREEWIGDGAPLPPPFSAAGTALAEDAPVSSSDLPVDGSQAADADMFHSPASTAAVFSDIPANGQPVLSEDTPPPTADDPPPSSDPDTPDSPEEEQEEDDPDGTEPEEPADPKAERRKRFSLWAKALLGTEVQAYDNDALVDAICGKYDPVTRSHTIKVVKRVEQANGGRKIMVSRDHLVSIAKKALKQAVTQYDPETDGDFVAHAKERMEQAVRAELRPQIMHMA